MIASKEKTARIPGIAGGLVLLVAAAFLCLPVGAGARDMVDEAGPTTLAEVLIREFELSRKAHNDASLAIEATYPPEADVSQSRKAPSADVPAVEKATLKYDTAKVIVDARKHCLYIGQPPASGQGALRIDLERGVTYTVSAAGEAFMSGDTGVDADPFPSVVFYYSTDEEDGYAVRYVLLKPGDSVTFKTPSLISPQDEVFATAFFLDAWPDSDNRGSYTLTFQRAEKVENESPVSSSFPPPLRRLFEKTSGTGRNSSARDGGPSN
jgi:hypothetical protein